MKPALSCPVIFFYIFTDLLSCNKSINSLYSSHFLLNCQIFQLKKIHFRDSMLTEEKRYLCSSKVGQFNNVGVCRRTGGEKMILAAQRCLLLQINRDYQQGIEYLPVNVLHILMHNIVAQKVNYLLLFCYYCWYTDDLTESVLRAEQCGWPIVGAKLPSSCLPFTLPPNYVTKKTQVLEESHCEHILCMLYKNTYWKKHPLDFVFTCV